MVSVNSAEIWQNFRDASVTIVAFFPTLDPKNPLIQRGTGTFIDKRGHVVTCLHVVQSNDQRILNPKCERYVYASKIFAGVTALNGKSFFGRIELKRVGSSGALDIAVLKPTIKINKQFHLRFADILKVIPGTFCMSIGNPGGFDADSCVTGVVRDNSFQDYQIPYSCCVTTLLIQGGNSGGAFIDQNGRILGIVQFNTGVQGFAGGCSSNTLKFVVTQIIKGCESEFVNKSGDFKTQWINGCTFDGLSVLSQIGAGDPGSSLIGEIVTTGNDVLTSGTICTKVNGRAIDTSAVDCVTIEDVTIKTRIGDYVSITYKNAQTNWAEETTDFQVVEMPCNFNVSFGFVQPNGVPTIIPTLAPFAASLVPQVVPTVEGLGRL